MRTELELLEDTLTALHLEGSHQEPQPHKGELYTHPGYRAVLCVSCGKPFIRGRNTMDNTCGRTSCEPALRAEDAVLPEVWGEC